MGLCKQNVKMVVSISSTSEEVLGLSEKQIAQKAIQVSISSTSEEVLGGNKFCYAGASGLVPQAGELVTYS